MMEILIIIKHVVIKEVIVMHVGNLSKSSKMLEMDIAMVDFIILKNAITMEKIVRHVTW